MEIEKAKKLLPKPEDKIGTLILLGGFGAVVFYMWATILPFLLKAMENTLYLAFLVSVLVAILYVFFDPKLRIVFFYIWRSFIRMLCSAAIKRDPLGVQKTYLERFKEKMEELDEGITTVRKQKVERGRALSVNEKEFIQTMGMAEAARAQHDDRIYAREARQVARLEPVIARQRTGIDRLDFIIKVMTRYREVCSDEVLDLEREIRIRQQEQTEARAFQKAMRAAKGILKGLPEKDMYDESTDVLEARYSQAIGEVEQLMDVTKDVISNADMADAAALQQMESKLTAWRMKNTGLAMGKTNKGDIIEASGGVLVKLPEQQSRETVPVNDYMDFFNKL